uniref:Uncharacterized protein n=1 Tax=Sphaerodactylus townsendi TaxID=933632 RepID=A0ACB8EVD7_9SAUR
MKTQSRGFFRKENKARIISLMYNQSKEYFQLRSRTCGGGEQGCFGFFFPSSGESFAWGRGPELSVCHLKSKDSCAQSTGAKTRLCLFFFNVCLTTLFAEYIQGGLAEL